MNRVWLTPFSAPLESTRYPEVNSHQNEGRDAASLQYMRANNSRLPFSTEMLKRFVEDRHVATGASMKTFY
ncbi:MAG TPA: hypothetical protein VN843_21755, partial [Anaerolineales bacterium]|nr:hypothetical protein [Anaerolineales bacterium]